MTNLLIIYNYYMPAEKAGGIVASLVNLVELMRERIDIHLICSNKDLDGTTLPVDSDHWISDNNLHIYYSSSGVSKELLTSIALPDCVYINGLYSLDYFIKPLRFFKGKCKVVIAPRGMLHKGALAVKPLKKKIFLSLFKVLQWHKAVIWHATDHQEVMDIEKNFSGAETKLALDTPARIEEFNQVPKTTDSLHLIFVSLITEKKNLMYLLGLMDQLTHKNITLDVYGPIKDHEYGRRCIDKIEGLDNVKYKGAIPPNLVREKIKSYHILILPTLGENFGHVIYESFSVGRPVIISTETPWQKLEGEYAGYNIELVKKEDWLNAMEYFYGLDQEAYDIWCKGAQKRAKAYWLDNDFKSQYVALFESN